MADNRPSGPKPTYDRLIIEFLLHWVSNEDLRNWILSEDEESRMIEWGLDGVQAGTLYSLSKSGIAHAIAAEIHDLSKPELIHRLDRAFMELGVDMDQIYKAIKTVPLANTERILEQLVNETDPVRINEMVDLMAYTTGKVHLRSWRVPTGGGLKAGVVSTLVIRGQGVQNDLVGEFQPGDRKTSIKYDDVRIGALTADVDVHQEQVICVKFPKTGEWELHAYNLSHPKDGGKITVKF